MSVGIQSMFVKQTSLNVMGLLLFGLIYFGGLTEEEAMAEIEAFQYRRGGGGGGAGGPIAFVIEILVMVAAIPVAITAWLGVDTTGWGTGPDALWGIGPLLIIAVIIYIIYLRVKSRA